ncbi:MAG: UvrD-helicase domain-containing protein, partial [Candidatus Acidiferrales bacterium]
MATLFDEPKGKPEGKPAHASDGLNPEQRAAVRHGEGPLMVVAGAGTGKTRVITERIRHLLETHAGLEGGEILGLTFTEKAAAEMKRRVVATAGERGERVVLGT